MNAVEGRRWKATFSSWILSITPQLQMLYPWYLKKKKKKAPHHNHQPHHVALWLACPTVTNAPLLEAMVAPENSLLIPSVETGHGVRGQTWWHRVTYMTLHTLQCLRFTFSEDSVEPVDGMFVAERQKKHIRVQVRIIRTFKPNILNWVSHNTHFLLSSGGSFMSFCILEAETFQNFWSQYMQCSGPGQDPNHSMSSVI